MLKPWDWPKAVKICGPPALEPKAHGADRTPVDLHPPAIGRRAIRFRRCGKPAPLRIPDMKQVRPPAVIITAVTAGSHVGFRPIPTPRRWPLIRHRAIARGAPTIFPRRTKPASTIRKWPPTILPPKRNAPAPNRPTRFAIPKKAGGKPRRCLRPPPRRITPMMGIFTINQLPRLREPVRERTISDRGVRARAMALALIGDRLLRVRTMNPRPVAH